MIKLKLEKNYRNQPTLKLSIKDEDLESHRMIKRALLESKKITKGEYNYNIPIRFFEPIFKNTNKCELDIDSKSISSFLEFSDDYDEKYYYISEANSTYMKKWRQEGCPYIYRISIDLENKILHKDIIFKKINFLE